jgi:hypothetical protein
LVFAGLACTGLLGSPASGQEAQAPPVANSAIASASQAEAAAVRFLGYSARERPELVATLERRGEGAQVPFLDASLHDQDIWHVVVSDAGLILASTSPDTPRHEVTFDVYLEAASGCVTKIVSRWAPDRPEGLPISSAASLAEKTHRSDDETWVSLGPAAPNLSLMQALDEVQQQGGEVLEAGQIAAYYVAMSRLQHPEPLPVWSIHLRGIPPMETPLPRGAKPVPEYARDHMRYVVNDGTGKCLFMTTTPQPDVPPGWTWDPETRSFQRPSEPGAAAPAEGEQPDVKPGPKEDKR